MPIYRTKCGQCGHTYETLYTSFSQAEVEEPKTTCPQCGSTLKTKEVGGTSFILRGKGWARDKYRGGRKK